MGICVVLDVLMVSAGPVPAPFGSPVYVGDMATALARAGCRVRLVSARRGVGEPLAGVDRPHPVARAEVSEAQPGPSLRRIFEDVRLVIDVVRALREHTPSVIVGHHGEGWLAARLGAAIAGVRAPIVYVLHTSFEDELPAWLPRLWTRASPWVRAVGAFVDRRVAGSASACLAPSPEGCARLRSWGAAHVELALPAVDVSTWARPSRVEARGLLGVDAGAPVALYAGNVDAYQDVPRWLDALAGLPDVHGLFALPAAPPSWLRLAVEARGLGARTTFVVANDPASLGVAHAASDVAVVPRAVCAGVPIKALNSLAYGLPTVGLARALPPLAGLTRVEGEAAVDLAAAVRGVLSRPDDAKGPVPPKPEAAAGVTLARWLRDLATGRAPAADPPRDTC
jgi:glycosyltransferase involved in cell wall biosynthesis